MKCPHCGAQLQENAQFCFFCMHSLDEKKVIAPAGLENRKKVYVILIAAFVLIASLLIVYFVWLKQPEKQLKMAEEPTEPIVSTFEDFQLRATYLTGKNSLSGLWDPDAFIHTHSYKDQEEDQWKIYATDVYIDEAKLQTYFCEGGTEVLTALTGLTDETMHDGLKLIECTVYSVYNYTFTNLQDMLTDRELYPMEEIEQSQQFLHLLGFPDPTGEQQDPGTIATVLRKPTVIALDGHTEQLMYLEIRTRTYREKKYYDIFILHTVPEEE